MKNTQEANVKKIVAFLEKNPDSDGKTISVGTEIPFITVWTVADKLRRNNKITLKNKRYTLADAPSENKVKVIKKNTTLKTVKTDTEKTDTEKTDTEKTATEKTATEKTVTEKTATEKTATEDKKNFGRDFSKLLFEGVEYRKGKCVLAIVTAYVKNNPKITFAKLEEVFLQSNVRTFGVFKESVEARKINSAGNQRYFGRGSQIIELGCGTKVSVTNQISKDNIGGILEAAKKVGLIVKSI